MEEADGAATAATDRRPARTRKGTSPEVPFSFSGSGTLRATMHSWLVLLGGALFIFVIVLLLLAWRSLDSGPPMG